MSEVIAELTKDWIDSDKPLRQVQWDTESILLWWGWETALVYGKDKIPWRLYDDDGELYYEGWLYEDDEAIIEQAVLDWGMHDSGCTEIQVKRNGKWVTEIG